MSSEDPQLEVLLACFEGDKRAGKVHHPLTKQLKADGAKILDEVVFAVTAKGKVRAYDPRRTVAGTLTPALTWGVFGLLASGGSWWSLVFWGVIGGLCGGLYAYYSEHLFKKDEIARLGKQLAPNSSGVLAYLADIDATDLTSTIASFQPATASVATVGADLSATVMSAATSPAEVPSTAGSVSTNREVLLTMLLVRYAGADIAKRVDAEASTTSRTDRPALETELLFHTDPDGRRHVASPTAGVLATGKGSAVSWGTFGIVFGTIAGIGSSGGLFGALEQGVATAIVWALFGLVAGALFGLWSGRAISARRLAAVSSLMPPDTSMVLAWAEGALSQERVASWSRSGSQQLTMQFQAVPHGAVIHV